jgi:CO/xanthine dehydrogenase Mo-binding subunit
MISTSEEDDDVEYGSYGLHECLDTVRSALADPTGEPAAPDGWLVGAGMAMSMIDTIPPRGHHSRVTIGLSPTGRFELSVGTAEFGNGTSTVHRQLAASVLGTEVELVDLRQSDTDVVEYDTGAFGSTGTVVAGSATVRAATMLRELLLARAVEVSGVPARECQFLSGAVDCAGSRLPLSALWLAAEPLLGTGSAGGSPRSIAFNVHGFRVAVNPGTGEIRFLRSIQAADAGRVINPMQCRGQIEGGVAQALGAALFEHVDIGLDGVVSTSSFRGYHLPTFADIPLTEVVFASTQDALGPMGAKSMSESPFNPVAPALANALRAATGVRFTQLPLSRDRVWLALNSASHPPPRSPR